MLPVVRLSPSRIVDYYLLMKILVTGSAGHLGEALIRTLKLTGDEPIGLDVKASRFTDCVGSITDRGFVRECVSSSDVVVHTATLHHLRN